MKLKLYTVDGMFDSKWGQLPLWRHAWNYCPYDPPNYRTKYYAHYGRTVSYKTFGDISYPYDRRISSNADLSVTNTTLVSGAKVDFAAGGKVTLGTGFTAQNGSSVRIRSWGTGLGKRIASSDDQGSETGSAAGERPRSIKPVAVVPECNDFFATGTAASGFNYQFNLTEPLPVGMAMFNCQGKLISRVNLGIKPVGPNRGTWTPPEKPMGLCVVRATIGNRVISRKVIIASR